MKHIIESTMQHLEDTHAHLVCVDGEVFNIENGGKAVTSVSHEIQGTKLSIFA